MPILGQALSVHEARLVTIIQLADPDVDVIEAYLNLDRARDSGGYATRQEDQWVNLTLNLGNSQGDRDLLLTILSPK